MKEGWALGIEYMDNRQEHHYFRGGTSLCEDFVCTEGLKLKEEPGLFVCRRCVSEAPFSVLVVAADLLSGYCACKPAQAVPTAAA